jgi:hypothetical protein
VDSAPWNDAVIISGQKRPESEKKYVTAYSVVDFAVVRSFTTHPPEWLLICSIQIVVKREATRR